MVSALQRLLEFVELLADEFGTCIAFEAFAFGENCDDSLEDFTTAGNLILHSLAFGNLEHVAGAIAIGCATEFAQPLGKTLCGCCRIRAAYRVTQHLAELVEACIELGGMFERMDSDGALADDGFVVAGRVLRFLIVRALPVILRDGRQIFELVLAEALRAAHRALPFQKIDGLVADQLFIADTSRIYARAHNAPANHLAV